MRLERGRWEWVACWAGLRWFAVLPALHVVYNAPHYWSVHFSFTGFQTYIEYYNEDKD